MHSFHARRTLPGQWRAVGGCSAKSGTVLVQVPACAPAMPGQASPTSEALGSQLRVFRERAGLTQEELAERAGLTPHAVSALERGTRTRPYPHTLRSLPGALGLSDVERAALIASIPARRAGQHDTAAGHRPLGLVLPPTRLYGRDGDVAAVVELVRSGVSRLVTLTGPGGVGKTRLIAEVSDALAAGYPDGTVQVALAPAAGPHGRGSHHRPGDGPGRERRTGRARRRYAAPQRPAPVARPGQL